MSALELVKVGLLAELAVAMPVLSVWIARQACKRIDANTERVIGHIKAAGLASAALDDEFGPPPAVPVEAGVQAGRHRELRLVGSKRPTTRRVMAMVYRLAAG